MTDGDPFHLGLTPFKDPLPIPRVLYPRRNAEEGIHTLTVRLQSAMVSLHSELPPTPAWTYEGTFPGPTIEVPRGERVRVVWRNEIDTPIPIDAVVAPAPGESGPWPQNQPGDAGATPVPDLEGLPAWTVVHLHGGRTEAASDGWTENMTAAGQSATSTYDLQQRAAMLWYHDHAMNVTRFTVMSGLAGLFVVRDDAEDAAANLPGIDREVPLLIQDRNLQTDADGKLTGRILHKTDVSTPEFFGPYTLVNGRIWPYLAVASTRYRLRLLNGSNARTYRLVLQDDQGACQMHRVVQVGADGGLLGAPVLLTERGLTLAPAERADLVVDFSGLEGRCLHLVNGADAPYDGDGPPAGQTKPQSFLVAPNVMAFHVGGPPAPAASTGAGEVAGLQAPARSGPPAAVLSDFQRLSHAQLPEHEHRWVALVEATDPASGKDMVTLRELQSVPGPPGPGKDLLEIKGAGAGGTSTFYEVVATRFEDTVNFFPTYRGWEVWNIVNLTSDMHPFHVHLVAFQIFTRQAITLPDTLDSETCSTKPGSPVQIGPDPVPIDANEAGWKDVVRAYQGTITSIAMQFNGFVGRYMYHCHILEHEDMEMMRPFVVVPGPLKPFMNMGGGGGTGAMAGMSMASAAPAKG